MRLRLLGALLLSGAMAFVVLAQQPRPGGMGAGMMANPGMLLANKTVQEDLKLTEDQISKVKELGERRMEAFKGFKEMSKEERQDAMKKMNEDTEKVVKELKPEQTARLKQIQLQQVGVILFTNEDMAKNLGLADEAKKITLSDDQKEKLKDITDQAAKDGMELFKSAGGFSPDTMKKVQALRKEAAEKSLNVLSSEQKKTWTEMTGKTLEIQFDFPGGPRKKNPDK
jgi:hypothetical protein